MKLTVAKKNQNFRHVSSGPMTIQQKFQQKRYQPTKMTV